MHSHLDIKVNGQSMTLPEDFSLSVTEENPIFHNVGMHSDPVRVPMDGNRTIFLNVDDPQSAIRPNEMEHLPAGVSIEGLPLRSGMISVQEDEEIVDSFSFNIDERAQSLEELIGDLKCQDIQLFNNELIPIGEKICDVNVAINYTEGININYEGNEASGTTITSPKWSSCVFEPQALGFSYPAVCTDISSTPRPRPDEDGVAFIGGMTKTYPGGISVKVPAIQENYINVSDPYQSVGGKPAEGAWRYCNARVCYAHHGLDTSKAVDDIKDDNGKIIKKGTIGESTDEIQKVDKNFSVNEDYGPYWVLDAQRPQSGICFYVLYFLDCLFAHLGVTFDNSALTAIEDLRRLAFFTTKCKYVTDITNASTTLSNLSEINKWLEDRGCGGRIEVNDTEKTSVNDITLDEPLWGKTYIKVGDEVSVIFATARINSISVWGTIDNYTATAKVAKMYATNENFPEESVKTIIDSLENSFGIRFRYDYQINKVTAYLYRDVFRDTDNIITLPVTLLTPNKLTEKITGVRMKYSAESDGYEQKENIRRAKRDYDTDFDYIDYRDGRTKMSDNYLAIANDLHAENITCYVDKNTANAYRFKISKDVDSSNIAYHRLFEVGQFHGIEVGDCSKANENFVKELVSDFQPMSFNDVNAYAELRQDSTQSLLAAFVDEEMEHEFVTQKINHAIASSKVDMYATEVLNLVESYDPTKTDDGNSPLQSTDWGLAVAIMRGGGTDAFIQNFDRGYDGFDNSRWKTIAGGYVMSSDTMDQFGNQYDYNGTGEGDGGGERFSLKIRSWKPFLYYEDSSGKTHTTSDLSLLGEPVDGVEGKIWLIPCSADDAGQSASSSSSDDNSATRIARRGLADTFMSEYIWFLLNRRKLRLHCLAEPSVLIDIPNHWDSRFRIGDYICYIDKFSYTVDTVNGLGEVVFDVFAV